METKRYLHCEALYTDASSHFVAVDRLPDGRLFSVGGFGKLNAGGFVKDNTNNFIIGRVSEDEGRTWSAPLSIVPVRHRDIHADSCGYTHLVPVDSQTCMLGFSDFNYDPGDGYPRKALFSQMIRIVP